MLYRIYENESTDNTLTLERRRATTLADIGYREADLQTLLIRHLDQVIRTDELLPLTQSRPGEEMPDILAVDRLGKLFIFELKRNESESENLLQVMRYAQNASEWDSVMLERLFAREEEVPLDEFHRDHFGLERPLEDWQWNYDQALVVITNGLDSKTRKAVRYWKAKGIDIRPWVFRIYRIEDSKFIDINAFGETDDPFEDKLASYHLVNTNYGNDPISHDYMLEEKRAAAFYGKWKYKIDNIGKGDWVFLYQSGRGVVAYGQCASDKPGVKEPPHGAGDYQQEHYVDLDPFFPLQKPISASRLREWAGYHVPLLATYTSVRAVGGAALKAYCAEQRGST